jgi:hypothetical protein
MSEVIENTHEPGTEPGRDKGHRFLPGISGNPNGRPKKEKAFSEIARNLLASNKIDIEYTFPSGGTMKTAKVHLESTKTIYHGLVAALVKEGMEGNVQAIKELIDRTEGKAHESVAMTFNDETPTPPIPLADLSEEEKRVMQNFVTRAIQCL